MTLTSTAPNASALAPTNGEAASASWLPSWRPSRISWTVTLAGCIAVVSCAAVLSAADFDDDHRWNIPAVLSRVGLDLLRLRWQFMAIVVALAGLHYLATALAVRAAVGAPLPLPETLRVQLAAAAANRLTAGGLGAAAVNTRYFTRRGLTLPAALGAVMSLHLLGPLADGAVLAVLVLLGGRMGLSGGGQELHRLALTLASIAGPVQSPWFWFAVGLGAVLLVGVARFRPGRARHPWRAFCGPILELMRRPGRLTTVLAASGSTTLILASAFVVSVAVVPGPRPAAGIGALMIAYMVGAAAGTAVPAPAGLGSTEAALVATLTGLHVPTANAIEQVVVFRLVTFWLPAAFGVLTTRQLRRSKAL